MRLTYAQEALLAAVKKDDTIYREGKRSALARAKILAEQEVAVLLHNRDRAVRLAFEAGVSKKKIGELGLSTTAPQTVLDSLARTQSLAGQITSDEDTKKAAAELDPISRRYQATTPADPTQPQTLTVTLDADTLEAAMIAVRVEHSARAAVARDFGGPTTFTVDRDDFGGRRFTPEPIDGVDPSGFIFALGERHPVWAWMQQSENRAEAAAWMAGRDMNEAAA